MLDNIGAAVGPLIAFLILLIIPDGFSTVFVASLAFAVMGVVILALVVPNVRTRSHDTAERRAQGLPRRAFPWSVVTRGPLPRALAPPALDRKSVARGKLG